MEPALPHGDVGASRAEAAHEDDLLAVLADVDEAAATGDAVAEAACIDAAGAVALREAQEGRVEPSPVDEVELRAVVDDGLAVDGRAEFRAARRHSAHDPGIDGERHQVVDPLFVGHVSHDVGEADAEVDHAARQELHGCPTRDDLPVVEDKGGQHPRGNPDLTGEGGIVLDTPGLHVMPRLRHHHRVHEHAGDTHLARVEIETLYRQLLQRLDRFEVSGPVERLSSITNGSIKHLPLRYRMA